MVLHYRPYAASVLSARYSHVVAHSWNLILNLGKLRKRTNATSECRDQDSEGVPAAHYSRLRSRQMTLSA